MKFEELLAKYGISAEEVTFEIEGLSDEELEAKFAETFAGNDDTGEDEGDNGDGVGDGTDDNVSRDDNSDDEDVNEGNDGDDEGAEDGEPETFTKTFTVELSHDDIRNALYVLIRQYETEDEYFYIREVFDNYFVMQDWYNNKIYKQNYTVDGEEVTLDGDRVEVFEILVTKEEKDALDALKENYSALETKYNELKEFKDSYDAAELKAKKDAVLARDEYSVLADDEAFNTLKANINEFSIDEVESKAKAIFADHVIKMGTFSKSTEKVNKVKTVGINFNTVESKSPYGNLFAKK